MKSLLKSFMSLLEYLGKPKVCNTDMGICYERECTCTKNSRTREEVIAYSEKRAEECAKLAEDLFKEAEEFKKELKRFEEANK